MIVNLSCYLSVIAVYNDYLCVWFATALPAYVSWITVYHDAYLYCLADLIAIFLVAISLWIAVVLQGDGGCSMTWVYYRECVCIGVSNTLIVLLYHSLKW